jgi:hypothetical protein
MKQLKRRVTALEKALPKYEIDDRSTAFLASLTLEELLLLEREMIAREANEAGIFDMLERYRAFIEGKTS